MPRENHDALTRARDRKLGEAIQILQELGFGSRQTNEVGGYTLLALINLKPVHAWADASDPLRGITPIIDFVSREYGVRYAPNTRETIRDEAVKHFVESGMLIRNPDDPKRPTNSGRTVYQGNPLHFQCFVPLAVINGKPSLTSTWRAGRRSDGNSNERDCSHAFP